MMSSNNVCKNPVETLSKSNWRQVFTDLKLWLESKGLFYVFLHEKQTYCSVTHYSDRVPTDIEILTASVAALHVKKDGKPEKLSVNQSSDLSHERLIQWDKDEFAVIYWLRRCCGNDLDIIEENDTSKKIWDALFRKYSKVRAGDLWQLEREITSFNRQVQTPGKSPEECFNYLKVLRRRFLQQRPEKKDSLRNEDLFGYLLDGLVEEEWTLTKNTLDAQPNLETDDKLEILQQLWDSTPSLKRNEEDGFIAKSRWPNSRFQKQRQRDLPASPED